MIYEHPESKNATLGPIQTCSASSVAIFVSFSAQSQSARELPGHSFRVSRVLDYPGYQRFFSRAAGIFGVGRSHERVTIKTRQKPETALEKSLASRVVLDRKFMKYQC